SSNRDELQKSYLDFYAHYFPGIRVRAPLAIADDAANNSITTTESYDIADFSSWSESEKHHVAPIYVPDIEELLGSPASTERHAPLAVRYPVDIVQTTTVLLPDDGWKIKPNE